MKRQVREIARQVPVFGERDALATVLDELGRDTPAVVMIEGIPHFLRPEDAVGHHPNRRLIDLPLKPAIIVLPETTLPEVIGLGGRHGFLLTKLSPDSWGIIERVAVLEELLRSVVPMGTTRATTTVLDLLDHSPEGIVILDETRRLQATNATGRMILEALAVPMDGTRITSMCGVPMTALIDQSSLGFPVDVMTREPAVRIFTVRALRSGEPEVGDVVLILRDVTHLRHRQSREAEQDRLEMLGLISLGIIHDLNNLLTIVQGETSLMKLHELPEGVKRGGQAVMDASRRSALLLRQLLAFGRRELSSAVAIDLPAHLLDLEGILRRLATPKNRVVILPAAKAAPILADPVQIDRILTNLVANARDAMPEGGDIIIEVKNVAPDPAKPGRPEICLTVKDTGPGMNAEIATRAFEIGFSTKGTQGHGLGLANVRATVVQMGGRVELQTRPGQGARFDIFLPSHTGYNPALSISDGPNSTKGRHSGNLVVFDGDSDVRDFILRVLRQEGFRVKSAGTEEDVKGLLATWGEPDLLLADLMIDGVFQSALLDNLRERYPKLRTLLLSGVSHPKLLQEAESPLVEYLPKPFTAQDLFMRVRGIVGDPVDGPG